MSFRAASLAIVVVVLPQPGCGECDLPTDCDVRDDGCRSRILDVVECVRGVDMPRVEVHVVPFADFVDDASEEAEQAENADCARQWYRGLSLLDLLRPGTDLVDASRADAGQIAGFYSGTDDAITLIDYGQPHVGSTATNLFVHESIHAWQHARFPDVEPADPTLDGVLALSAVVEGQATLYTAQVSAADHGFDIDEVDWSRGFDAGERLSLPGQRRSDPWLRVQSTFAYTYGASYVVGAYDQGGQSGADALLESPPSTTREVLAGFGAPRPGDGWLEPSLFSDGVPDLSAFDMHHVASRRTGSFVLASMLVRLGAEARALALARELAADLMSLFVDQDGSEAAIAWRLRFASTGAAEETRAALVEGLARQESLWGQRLVEREERDVFVVATTRPGRIPSRATSSRWSPSATELGGACDPPPEISELDAPRVVELALGGSHSCALLDTGAVRCWGNGRGGRLGYASVDSIGDDELPAAAGDVPLGDRAVSIAVGLAHSCAVLANGDVRCWGDNGKLQVDPARSRSDAVGDDEPPSAVAPLERTEDERFVQVAASSDHSCAVTEQGALRCWGDLPSLQPLPDGVSAVQVVTGSDHVCVLLSGGGVHCWIERQFDPAADMQALLQFLGVAPTPGEGVVLGGSAVQLAAGTSHTCARLDDGAVRCWDTEAMLPRTVELPRPAVDVAVGGGGACAVLAGGELWCWGSAGSPIRTGTGESREAAEDPVRISLPGRVVRAGVAGGLVCAVSTSGAARCWGSASLLGLGGRSDFGEYGPAEVGNVALF